VSDVYVHTIAPMGTVVTIQVVGNGEDDEQRARRADGVFRAAGWFESVEQCCSRFDPASELRRLSATVGSPVRVSQMLFEAIRFALAVAEDTDGAFDPTIGRKMESRGFDRDYRTVLASGSGRTGLASGSGRTGLASGSGRTGLASGSGILPDDEVSWRDVRLDRDAMTVTLLKPLVLDLGAVAKGLAVDVAARELSPFENFAVDAGGDLYLGGRNAEGAPWSVGIRHPREESLIETLRVSNTAVCTSGDYQKRSPNDESVHHIMDARTGETAAQLASVTVLAPSAMVADAFATAAFALGRDDGLRFLERHGVRGLLVTPELERFETAGFA
jgi:thiamine biosynthesis lipoprotein